MSSDSGFARVQIEEAAAARLGRDAVHRYPEECCGLLLGRWLSGGVVEISKVVPVANAASPELRRRRFSIEPRVILEWDRIAGEAGLSIVGFVHSHPDASARPSETDAGLAWPGYVYVIVSTIGREDREPIVGGIAAWTFDEPTHTFREVPVDVRPGEDAIDYVI